MALPIRFTLEAEEDLFGIRAHIGLVNPDAAETTIARVQQTILLLADFPELAPIRWLRRERRFPVPGLPYRIHYRVDPDELVILSVFHGKRKL